MKKRIRSCIWGILFVFAFLILLNFIDNIVRSKVHNNDTIKSFYKEKKDSCDVLFVGTSRVYFSLSPMELWNSYGFTSYNLGSQSQSLPSSYYLIKDAIKKQHPKLIVLDSWGARYNSGYSSIVKLHKVIDAMPFSMTKVQFYSEFVRRYIPSEEQLEFCFPIIRNHGRWRDLKKEDFVTEKRFVKGYQPSAVIKKQTAPEINDEIAEMSAINKEYLDRIIDECKRNDVELVVCTIPCPAFNKYIGIHKRTNDVLHQAEERGIKVVNFDHYRDEIGLDYERDFKDHSHLNTIGAKKMTNYLGGWLKENYDLPDHRSDAEYQSWNNDYMEYEQMLSGMEERVLDDSVEEGDE